MLPAYFSFWGPLARCCRKCHEVIATVLCLVFFASCSSIGPVEGVAPQEYTLTVTGYCHCGKCTGWKRTWYLMPVHTSGPNKGRRKLVGLTAGGTKVRHGVIAADTSVFPFGTVMYVPGYGYGRVEDTGGAIKGYSIDVYFSSHSKAMKWGRQELRVKVWVPSGAHSGKSRRQP